MICDILFIINLSMGISGITLLIIGLSPVVGLIIAICLLLLFQKILYNSSRNYPPYNQFTYLQFLDDTTLIFKCLPMSFRLRHGITKDRFNVNNTDYLELIESRIEYWNNQKNINITEAGS